MTETSYRTGGLVPIFNIERLDGEPIDPDHRYFVLDFSGADPHAFTAAVAYANSVRPVNPVLADDIIAALADPVNAPAQHSQFDETSLDGIAMETYGDGVSTVAVSTTVDLLDAMERADIDFFAEVNAVIDELLEEAGLPAGSAHAYMPPEDASADDLAAEDEDEDEGDDYANMVCWDVTDKNGATVLFVSTVDAVNTTNASGIDLIRQTTDILRDGTLSDLQAHMEKNGVPMTKVAVVGDDVLLDDDEQDEDGEDGEEFFGDTYTDPEGPFDGELITELDVEFVDISSESWRQYENRDGTVVFIDDPLFLNVGENGHRVLDGRGVCHYVPTGDLLRITWRARDGEPHFVT